MNYSNKINMYNAVIHVENLYIFKAAVEELLTADLINEQILRELKYNQMSTMIETEIPYQKFVRDIDQTYYGITRYGVDIIWDKCDILDKNTCQNLAIMEESLSRLNDDLTHRRGNTINKSIEVSQLEEQYNNYIGNLYTTLAENKDIYEDAIKAKNTFKKRYNMIPTKVSL